MRLALKIWSMLKLAGAVVGCLAGVLLMLGFGWMLIAEWVPAVMEGVIPGDALVYCGGIFLLVIAVGALVAYECGKFIARCRYVSARPGRERSYG